MSNLIQESLYFGLALNLTVYWIGIKIKKKFKGTLFNPLLISTILVILVLRLFDIEYEVYNASGKYLTYLLTPATVCLAVPLYKQIAILKENLSAVLVSLTAGCAVCAAAIIGLSALFNLDSVLYKSLLPKSITTAIAIDVASEIGGIYSVTIMAVIFTGLFGAVIAVNVFKLLKIKEPVAQGLACGASAHAIGTSKAIELGEIQAAMSSLAIIITGLFTVILAPILAGIIS